MTVTVRETPIAWWVPARGNGKKLVLFRRESSRFGTSYSYRGDGTSGNFERPSDEDAVRYVEEHVVPMQKKMKRER
jgi:hypothetical protein